MSAPHQRFAYINRTRVNMKAPETSFFTIYTDYYFLARNRIGTFNGMDAYIYFASRIPHTYNFIKNPDNKNERPIEISPQAMSNETGIDRTSCQRGINKLIEKGYLKLIRGNTYQFIDILDEDKVQSPTEHQQVLKYEVTLEESMLIGQNTRQEQLKQIAENNVTLKQEEQSRRHYDWE